MPSSANPNRTVASSGPSAADPALEALLAAVEGHLNGLGEALRRRDAQAIDTASTELHRSLVGALDGFSQAARTGQIPPNLRSRLAQASGQVVVHRECLARATAALDRAVDALMPNQSCGLYGPQGSARLPIGGASVRA